MWLLVFDYKFNFFIISTNTLTTILLPACLYIWVLLQGILKVSGKSIKRKHSRGVNLLIKKVPHN